MLSLILSTAVIQDMREALVAAVHHGSAIDTIEVEAAAEARTEAEYAPDGKQVQERRPPRARLAAVAPPPAASTPRQLPRWSATPETVVAPPDCCPAAAGAAAAAAAGPPRAIPRVQPEIFALQLQPLPGMRAVPLAMKRFRCRPPK